MKEQLVHYVDLLFAGAPDAEEIKQEILQNTLDRYDDLIDQGKSPEAAYRLAISGIGDINEILDDTHGDEAAAEPMRERSGGNRKLLLRAIAIALYIASPVPLFLIGDEVGLSLLLVLVAVATAIMVIAGRNPKTAERYEEETYSPHAELHKSVGSVVWTLGLIVYFVVSFVTGAWYITWLIFPLTGCVNGLVKACIDLKEV